jgi:hypothetical protein
LVALQLAEAVSDVVATGRTLGEAHRRAIRVFMARESPGRPVPVNDGQMTALSQPRELATLSVLFKAWLFFVRGFSDNAYRLLLSDLENRPAPRKGSMSAVLKPLNPVAKLFEAKAPEVPGWFEARRALRNDMKDGAAFAFSELDARGLALMTYQIRATREPDPRINLVEGPAIRFSDVVDDAGRIIEVLAVLAESQETQRTKRRPHDLGAG